jgi:hypothetical protein
MIMIATFARRILILPLAAVCLVLPLNARAASCKTQSQMTAAERIAISSAARAIAGDVQSGNVTALRAITIPAVTDFSGIAGSVDSLKPLLRNAFITINNLYDLDASTERADAARVDFYCGTPVVVMNIDDLPPGTYALAILHATGVPQPQQISLILSNVGQGRWMLAGFFSRPMLDAGHDGLWYWVSARKYAQKTMNWDALLYYRIAAIFLNPVDFLSSPNLEKLRHEEDQVHPDGMPGIKPLMLPVSNSVFTVTRVDTTTTFGALDLEVHYTPDATQSSQLRDPMTARKQVTAVMIALLSLHPELHDAFHGIWVQADKGSDSIFSLELPMDQIVSDRKVETASHGPGAN